MIETEKFPAKICDVSHRDGALHNVVYLNHLDYQRFFIAEGQAYIRLADRVYTALAKSWVQEGWIGMSPYQKEQLELNTNRDRRVFVTPFKPDERNHRESYCAAFQLSTKRQFTKGELQDAPLELLKSSFLVKKIQSVVTNQFLHLDQQFPLTISGEEFSFKCIAVEGKRTLPQENSYELITKDTDIVVLESGLDPYVVVDHCESETPKTFHFNVSLVVRDCVLQKYRPFFIKVDEITAILKKALLDKFLVSSYTFVAELDCGLKAHCMLEKITPKVEPDFYAKAFQLQSDSICHLTSCDNQICLVDCEPSVPESVVFELIEEWPSTSFDEFFDPCKTWIINKDLENETRSSLATFNSQTLFLITLQGYKYYVKPDYIHCEKGERYSVLGSETILFFRAGKAVKKTIVQNEELHPLASATFEINSFSDDFVVLDKARIKSAIRQFTPKARCVHQNFTVLDKDGVMVNVTTLDLRFTDKRLNSTVQGYLGQVTDTTKITLVAGHESNILFEKKISQPLSLTPEKALESVGLTGLPKKVVRVVELLLYQMGPLKRFSNKLKLRPPKGILLHGPPGTGKTTFARGVGRLLNIPEERITEIAGPDIHHNLVGGNEENIRELFAPALEDSQLHLIVIDEIDAIAANRDDGPTYMVNTADALLASMSGLKDHSNVIVIGTTNFLERIDKAFLRPGRFGTLLEFRLPDAAGRRDILEFHTRDLRAKNLISDDVDLKWYANHLDGLSGDHLKGLTQAAKENCGLRLGRLQITDDKIKSAKDPFLTKEDFDQAYDELKAKDEKIETFMYY